jgi:hypothetical protein
MQSICSTISESESLEIGTVNESFEITAVNKNPEVVNESSEINNESSETATVNKKRKRNKQSWVFKEGHFIKHDPQNGKYICI